MLESQKLDCIDSIDLLAKPDCLGRQILTGLIFAETREFELLDAEPPVDERGHLLRWETDDKSPPNQVRWLTLYKDIKLPVRG
jgi:hypothetical protein